MLRYGVAVQVKLLLGLRPRPRRPWRGREGLRLPVGAVPVGAVPVGKKKSTNYQFFTNFNNF